MDEVNNKIKPTDDYIFKRLFGVDENKDLLIAFLNALFDEYECFPNIIDLEYKNNNNKADSAFENKFYRNHSGLDVRAKINENTYVDIEVQTEDTGNLISRSVFYNSMMMVDSIDEGNKIKNIPRVISIWIVKDKLRDDNKFKDYKSPIVMTNIKSEDTKFGDKSEVISDKFNIIFIFLSKFKEGMLNNNLENWLKFIDNQNVTEVKDDKILKAYNKLTILRGDKHIKNLYDAEFKYKFNLAMDLSVAHEDGLKEGLKNKSIEIAKNMLKEGLDVKLISKLSGLTVEEIKLIKK